MPPPLGRRPPPPPPGSNVDVPPPLPGGRDAVPRKPSRQEENPPQLPPPRRPVAQQDSEEDIGEDYEIPSQELFNQSQNKGQCKILPPVHRPSLPPRNEVSPSYDEDVDTWSDEFSDVEEEPEGPPSTDYEVAEGGMPAPPPADLEPEGPDETYEICADQQAIKPQPAPPKKNSLVSALANKFKSIGVMGGPGNKEDKVAKVKPNIKGRKQSIPIIDDSEIPPTPDKTPEQPFFTKPPTPSKPTLPSKPEKPTPPTKPSIKPLKPTGLLSALTPPGYGADPKKNFASTIPDRKKSINNSEDNVSNGSSGSGDQVSRALPSRPWEVTSPNNSKAKNSEDKPKAFVSPQSRPTQPLPAYPDNDPDEIYDDAVSQHRLSHYDWFHMTDRKGGEALLRKLAVNGGYLVRESSKVGFYTLMIYIDGSFKNMNIRCRDSDQMYAIGKEKAEEVAFPSVAGLIEYHQKHHLTVVDGASVKLNATPPKS